MSSKQQQDLVVSVIKIITRLAGLFVLSSKQQQDLVVCLCCHQTDFQAEWCVATLLIDAVHGHWVCNMTDELCVTDAGSPFPHLPLPRQQLAIKNTSPAMCKGRVDWWEGKAFINNKYCKKLIDGLQSFLFGFAGSAVVVDQ